MSRRGQSCIERGKGVCYQWKAKGEEKSEVSGTMRISVQNRHQKPLHLLGLHHQEVDVRREKGASEAGVRLGRPIDSCAKTSRKVVAPNYLVTAGILPNVSFFCQNRVENSAITARLHTSRLKDNPAKTPKKDGDKSAVAKMKDVRQLGCVLQDTEPPVSSAILRKGTQVLGPIRRVRFTRAALRQANIRENKGPHQRSP